MMYLPKDKWSSRYEQQFYTIQIQSYSKLNKPPTGASDSFTDVTCQFLCGPKFPAVYYSIEISCGTKHHSCLRRYSQFQLLCNKVDPSGKLGLQLKLPPKTGLFHQETTYFLKERMQRLNMFLEDFLTRQEAVDNAFVEQFLDLHIFKEA